jgi:hypothetical protein
VRVKNLPKDFEYGNNDIVLRAKLWQYFQNLNEMNNQLKVADITFAKPFNN